MTGPSQGAQVEGDDDVLILLGISRAHLHSPLATAVFVSIWRSLQVVQSNNRKVLDMINLIGVSLGKFSIFVGYRKVMDTLVRLVRQGDEISLIGRRSLCNAFRGVEKELVGQDDSCDWTQL